MARRPTSRRGKTGIRIDLSGVEVQKKVPEGEYVAKVKSVKEEEGNAAPYLAWSFTIDGGDYEGATLYYNTSLAEQSLWNLRGLLEALDLDIPDSAFDLDTEDLVDRRVNLVVEIENYEGKRRPRVVDFSPVEDEEDEKPAKGKRRSAKDDDDDEDDRPTRKRRASSDDEDEKPARRRRGAAKDDDDEDEKPAKRGGKAAKKKSAPTQEDIDEMDEDGLEGFINEHDLDVDLSKYKTLRKMKAAVIDAAQDAEILGE